MDRCILTADGGGLIWQQTVDGNTRIENIAFYSCLLRFSGYRRSQSSLAAGHVVTVLLVDWMCLCRKSSESP